MKKVIFLLLMFAAFQLNAQKFHIIPKVGLNLANMTNSGGSMSPGLNIGASGEVMLSSIFAIEPGLYFSMQSDGFDAVNYLNVPVHAKLYLYHGLFGFAGPQLGINVSEYYNTFDCSLGIGVGYQFSSGFQISANYNYGLMSVSDEYSYYDGYNYYYDDGNYHNSVFQLNLGWRF